MCEVLEEVTLRSINMISEVQFSTYKNVGHATRLYVNVKF